MIKQTVLIVATLLSVNASADLANKAPLKADFRSMIDNTYSERTTLANGVNENIAHKRQQPLKKDADQRRVTDFVDVEIGWGEAPQMVDRRFDSVDESEHN